MVGISILSSRDVAITTPIPSPVIILAGMGVAEWKNFFIQKKCETTENGMNVQFYFSFPTLAVRTHFDRNVKNNVDAITDPTLRSRPTV